MKKKTKGKRKKHIIIGISVIALALLALVAIAAFVLFNSINSAPISWRDRAPDKPTQSVTGKVTRINKNSLDYMLDDDGNKAPGPLYGVTDVGDAIYVDGQLFQTSSGGTSEINSFHIDIESIELGDRVTVSYAVTESGKSTLNCKQCTVVRRNQ